LAKGVLGEDGRASAPSDEGVPLRTPFVGKGGMRLLGGGWVEGGV